MSAVVVDTFAALSLAGTGFIGTIADIQVVFQMITFHNRTSLLTAVVDNK